MRQKSWPLKLDKERWERKVNQTRTHQKQSDRLDKRVQVIA